MEMGARRADCWFEPSTEPWLGGWVSVDGELGVGSLTLRIGKMRIVLTGEDVPTITFLAVIEDREIWKRLHGETYWRGVYPDDVFRYVRLSRRDAAVIAAFALFDRVRLRFRVEVGGLEFRRSDVVGIRTGFLWNIEYGVPRFVVELGALAKHAAMGFTCGGDPIGAVRHGLSILGETGLFYPAVCHEYVESAISIYESLLGRLSEGF